MWKKVRHFPNYEVSSSGSVRNVKTGRILKGHVDKYGYRYVNLSKDKRMTSVWVARMVAEMFVAGKRSGTTVNHKNGEKLDNKATNLEWITPLQQAHHAYAIGRNQLKISPEQKREITRLYATTKLRQIDIARRYGICQPMVSLIVNNKYVIGG